MNEITTYGYIVTVRCDRVVNPDWIQGVIEKSIAQAINLTTPIVVHTEFCGELEGDEEMDVTE